MDLEELSKESEIIIVPDLTSTYCNIGAYQKKGLIATGFDFVYPRWQRHKRLFCEISQRSGLFTDYNRILEFLPNGKIYDKKNLGEMGLDKKDGARRIVDAIERIYLEYLSKGTIPPKNEDFKGRTYLSKKQLVSNRYAKALFAPIETTLRDIEGCDFLEAEKYVTNLLNSDVIIDSNNYAEYLDRVNGLIRSAIIESYENGNRDYIEQEYYIRSMYEINKFYEILNEQFDAKEMYSYYRGRYEISTNKNYEVALIYLERMINNLSESTFEESIAFTNYYHVSSNYWAGVCCYELHKEEAKGYFEMCESLTGDRHQKAREYLKMIE